MKRITFFLNASMGIVMLLLAGCCTSIEDDFRLDVEKELSIRERGLNLKAPNGMYIAENVALLKKKLAPIVEYSNWESKDFEIVSIQYDSLEVGICAEIEYVTEDGRSSNIIFERKMHNLHPQIKTRTEGGGTDESEDATYSCRNLNRKCKSCRTVRDRKNKQTRCACDDGLVEGCALYEYSI
ncbi:hypothetical protein DXA46_02015 [Bacteroides sp. OF02-3LB]|jgi:hypothetical protein|uniref:hypothetical protein n=1 Tax=Bacteroides TaxID=816 RepID=UPI000E517CDF|nr:MULTISPECIES: hypothetical protein [Bacteroides]QNL40514.1 hypothetical protein H8796_07995 [Bacteroides sp. M10]RGY36823.1 hypothetical protein DXA46_02015 [Bacteroides sp. OF02-3LB]